MQTIIGLGKAGCNIANCLKEYSEYNVLNIDVGLKKTKSTFGLKKQDSVELYEKSVCVFSSAHMRGPRPFTGMCAILRNTHIPVPS